MYKKFYDTHKVLILSIVIPIALTLPYIGPGIYHSKDARYVPEAIPKQKLSADVACSQEDGDMQIVETPAILATYFRLLSNPFHHDDVRDYEKAYNLRANKQDVSLKQLKRWYKPTDFINPRETRRHSDGTYTTTFTIRRSYPVFIMMTIYDYDIPYQATYTIENGKLNFTGVCTEDILLYTFDTNKPDTTVAWRTHEQHVHVVLVDPDHEQVLDFDAVATPHPYTYAEAPTLNVQKPQNPADGHRYTITDTEAYLFIHPSTLFHLESGKGIKLRIAGGNDYRTWLTKDDAYLFSCPEACIEGWLNIYRLDGANMYHIDGLPNTHQKPVSEETLRNMQDFLEGGGDPTGLAELME